MTTTGALLVLRPPGVPTVAPAASAVLLGAVLGLTALGAAPAHARLARGFDPRAYRTLLRVDAWRCLAAVGNVAVALWAAA